MIQTHVTDVLVKPTGPGCNLACEYCFYRDKEKLYPGRKTRMSLAVLETLISRLLAQPVKRISIGWQGGEPTLMGIPFFEKAIELMQQYGRGQVVANGLQTNGLLIDRQWAKFFRRYNFLIGLSIDGPEQIHDRYRKNRGGRGSWRKAVKAAGLLLDHGVEVNALTVINETSVQFPEEIYTFLKSIGLNYMQFIPCVETDAQDPTRAAGFSVAGKDYGHFLCKLFDLWLDDFSEGKPRTSIRFFEALLFKYAGLHPTECSLMEECGGYLVVEHTGDVYPCDFFVEPGWKLGNLLETPLEAFLNLPEATRFRMLKANLPQACRDCEWMALCRGGCPKDRLRDPQSGGMNHFCEGYRMFYPYADARLKNLVEARRRISKTGS